MIESVRAYLENVFGSLAKCESVRLPASFPLLISKGYRFYSCEMLEKPFVLAAAREGSVHTPRRVQKETRMPIRNEAANGFKNLRGTVAMARTMVVDSVTSQFFINLKDNGFLNYTALNPYQFGYAVFGRVTKGMDVVDKIAQVNTGSVGYFQDVPADPVVIKSMKIEE